MTMDPFGATPKAIRHDNYLVSVGRGTTRANEISQDEISDTHVIKKKKN